MSAGWRERFEAIKAKYPSASVARRVEVQAPFRLSADLVELLRLCESLLNLQGGQRDDLRGAIIAAADCSCEICYRPEQQSPHGWPHLKAWHAIVAMARGEAVDYVIPSRKVRS